MYDALLVKMETSITFLIPGMSCDFNVETFSSRATAHSFGNPLLDDTQLSSNWLMLLGKLFWNKQFQNGGMCHRHQYMGSPRLMLFGVVDPQVGQTGWSATSGTYMGCIEIYPHILALLSNLSHIMYTCVYVYIRLACIVGIWFQASPYPSVREPLIPTHSDSLQPPPHTPNHPSACKP